MRTPPAPESVEATLLKTAEWLESEFQKKRDAPVSSNQGLSEHAGLLRMFTQMWSIFQLAWRQSQESEHPMSQAIAAGNKVARGLYEVSQTADLSLVIPHQYLVVVPAGAEGYSVGFGSPTPYIISPYWGLSQVWTWLSYAHEIGHHVYRNIDGLEDELKINVTLELWKQGVDRKNQLIWFNWLEEIFADLFGLLRIGPAFAHTQQLMLDYLPALSAWPDVENRLLVAEDMSHPMPYLRIYLGLCALEKLEVPAGDLEPLWKRLNVPSGSEEPQAVYAFVHGGPQELGLSRVKEIAGTVLDVILETKLISLAKSSDPLVGRSLKEVFFDPGPGTYEKLLADIYYKLNDLLDKQPSGDDVNGLNERVIQSILKEQEAV